MGTGKDSVSSRSQGAALWRICCCVAVPFSFWFPFLTFLFVVAVVVLLVVGLSLGYCCGGRLVIAVVVACSLAFGPPAWNCMLLDGGGYGFLVQFGGVI